MRRVSGVMGSGGLALVCVGLWLAPGAAWAACKKVAIGTGLATALGVGAAGDTTIKLDVNTELCLAEGWSDPDGLECLSLVPGKDLTITVTDTNGDGTITTASLPGLYIPQITSTRSTVSLSDATLVGQCASTKTGGPTARLLVEGDHQVTLTDVTLKGGSLYGLYADDGLFNVTFTDPTTVFAEGFTYYAPVKLAAAGADYTQIGGQINDTSDTSALKSFGGTVTLADVSFTGNKGTGTAGGAMFIQNGTVTITGGSFTNNEAYAGGAIWAEASAILTLDGVSFLSNAAVASGGAVAESSAGTFTVKGGTDFTGDKAANGGALHLANGSFIFLEDTSFTSTSATSSGGAVYVTGGVVRVGNGGAAPTFTSTSAPTGGAVSLVAVKSGSEVVGATLKDIQGGYAIDVSSGSGATVMISGLTSPDGLGAYGLLRVQSDASVELSDSVITGVDGAGLNTPLAAGAALIDVKKASLELTDTVLCGFVAASDGKPFVHLDETRGSVTVSGNTFMNLTGVGDGQGLLTIRALGETIYLYNNSFIGELDGAQSGVLIQSAGGLFVFNNLFHQLAAGLLVTTSSTLNVSYNLYSSSVAAHVDAASGSYTLDSDSHWQVDPLLVKAFDPTRCSVWPYLTEGSPAVDAGTTYFDGSTNHGDASHLGAWGVILDGGTGDYDTDADGYGLVTDCDDANADVHPDAKERPGNGVDDDCDGAVDEGAVDTGGDTGSDDTGVDDTGADDTGVVDSGDDTAEDRPDTDGDGVPDEDDCAPRDPSRAEDCLGIFVYGGGCGGWGGCATAPPAGLGAMGLLLITFAGTRRRRPAPLV